MPKYPHMAHTQYTFLATIVKHNVVAYKIRLPHYTLLQVCPVAQYSFQCAYVPNVPRGGEKFGAVRRREYRIATPGNELLIVLRVALCRLWQGPWGDDRHFGAVFVRDECLSVTWPSLTFATERVCSGCCVKQTVGGCRGAIGTTCGDLSQFDRLYLPARRDP